MFDVCSQLVTRFYHFIFFLIPLFVIFEKQQICAKKNNCQTKKNLNFKKKTTNEFPFSIYFFVLKKNLIGIYFNLGFK